MFRRARRQAVAAVRSRGRACASRRRCGWRRAGLLGVPEQELEEADEVVGVPLAGRVRLAEPELAARREAPEERAACTDLEADLGPGSEAPHRAVREARVERPVAEIGEDALEHGGTPPARAGARAAAARGGVRGSRRRRSRPHRPLPRLERRLVPEGDALEPELERLPVDEPDHLHRHERVARRAPPRASGSSAPAGGRRASRRAARSSRSRHVDPRAHALARLRERVAVALVERHERRDVQALGVLVAQRPCPRRSSGSRSPNVLLSSATMQASSPSAR